jgi:hypothetical protein
VLELLMAAGASRLASRQASYLIQSSVVLASANLLRRRLLFDFRGRSPRLNSEH